MVDLLSKLQDKSCLEPISELDNLQGTLREYQKHGVSWLQYLERDHNLKIFLVLIIKYQADKC
ncbi:hypothetical protein [Desmonostoc muscorum]|uniref:hypothetical protein n=1 Tax=Desmonostoc muscorum TaxID=1179 RepID=UPI001F3AE3BF|nr:hypothetical protein [Desmonostoc muscorum]